MKTSLNVYSSVAGTSYAMSGSFTGQGYPLSLPVPNRDGGTLGIIRLRCDAITTAKTLVWFLSEDAVGNKPLTIPVSSSLVLGVDKATSGALVSAINEPVPVQFFGLPGATINFATAQTIYFHGKTDAGTVNAADGMIGVESRC